VISCAVSANQAWRSIAIRPRWSCDCEELMDSTSAAQFAKKCGFLVARVINSTARMFEKKTKNLDIQNTHFKSSHDSFRVTALCRSG
jgi:hypothetical protein